MSVTREETAKVLIVNRDGKLLVLRSSVWPERPDRSQKPDLAGGLVETYETAWQGVAREALEEVAIDRAPTDYKLIYAETDYHAKSNSSVTKYLFAIVVEASDVVLSWEHESYEWVSLQDFSKIEWRPFYKTALTYLLRHDLLIEFGAR